MEGAAANAKPGLGLRAGGQRLQGAGAGERLAGKAPWAGGVRSSELCQHLQSLGRKETRPAEIPLGAVMGVTWGPG